MNPQAATGTPLRVLCLEDSPEDAELQREQLVAVGHRVEWRLAATRDQFAAALRDGEYDVILADNSLPGFDALAALGLTGELSPATPFICVSGTIGEELTVELLKRGAVDVVIKDRPARLPSAVDRALLERSERDARREAQEARKLSDAKYADLFARSHSAIVVYEATDDGRDFVITAMNPASAALEQVAADDVVGRRVTEVFPGVEAFGLLEVLRRVWRFGQPEEHDVSLYSDDRIEGWRENSVYKLDSGEIIAVYDDVSARVRAEQALRARSEEVERQRQFLATLLDTIPSPVFYKDVSGVFLGCNREFERFVGRHRDEIVGKTSADIAPPEIAEKYDETDSLLLERPGTQSYESQVVSADGSRRDVFTNKATFTGSGGEVAGIIGVILDITERKRAEAALRQANDELERRVVERTADFESSRKAALSLMQDANRERERTESALAEHEILLREIHHRVKNNLNTVANILYFQSKAVDDEQARHAFEDSQDRIKSMARIHEHLYRSWDIATVDMEAYLRDLSDDLRQVHSAADLTISIDAAGVRLDIEHAVPCGLIVNELTTNACQHAFPDGRVGHIAIRLVRNDDICALEVRDDGVGLVADLDIETSSSLGLRLAGMLARQLGGDLVVGSEPGSGAAFSISFPAGDARTVA